MKKSNHSFFILQLLFVAAITSTLIFIGCSRTNTGSDPSPPGGEIIFAYNVDLALDGPGETSNNPIYHDKGITTVTVHVAFKADPEEPVEGVPVDFTVSGGGNFYDFDTFADLGRVARVYTNNSGNALVFYSTIGVWETRTRTWEEFGETMTEDYDVAVFDNQTITACVDEAKIGNQYENCRTVPVFLTGPEDPYK